MVIQHIFTGASILGAVCVSAGHAGTANLVWSISNPGLVYYNWRNGEIAQARMFGVFGILAIIGVFRGLI
jgi:hypothetical protein